MENLINSLAIQSIRQNCLSVCQRVPKDLTNLLTDMVLIYSEASSIKGRFITIFGGVYNHHVKRNHQKKKTTSLQIASSAPTGL